MYFRSRASRLDGGTIRRISTRFFEFKQIELLKWNFHTSQTRFLVKMYHWFKSCITSYNNNLLNSRPSCWFLPFWLRHFVYPNRWSDHWLKMKNSENYSLPNRKLLPVWRQHFERLMDERLSEDQLKGRSRHLFHHRFPISPERKEK